MIRFCNNEVYCIEYHKSTDEFSASREDLLLYFSEGHQNSVVCVYDDMSCQFIGIITYKSLQCFILIGDAVRTEYIVWDEDIWENARKYCRRHPRSATQYLIPVLDKNNRLFCFAYEDLDANREIRMLRELAETPCALQFTDIYPEYKYVRIYGFNELAYFMAKYLESLGITVEKAGAMWPELCGCERCDVPNRKCMDIYAEGTWQQACNWKENLLRSVSVEFECIDKVYEENIKQGIIKNAQGNINTLLRQLKKDENVAIFGIGKAAQDAYSYFLENGIDVCCFINDSNAEVNHRLFGKTAIDESTALSVYQHAVFVDCVSQHSAWGGNKIDYYDYIGYARNQQFIFLRDYIQDVDNCLGKAISVTKVFLMGDICLCKYLYDYMKKTGVTVEGYLDIERQDEKMRNLPRIGLNHIDHEMMCFIAVPEYFTPRNIQAEKIRHIIAYLDKNSIDNYSLYFSSVLPYIYIEKRRGLKYTKKELTPKRIVLGSIEGCCGNVFFRSLLDSHPEILMTSYNHVNDTLLNDNLFLLCVRASMEESEHILPLFWQIYRDENRNEICSEQKFNEKMEQLLRHGSGFTPQELFVAFHIAYMYMYGNDIAQADISHMVLYWEPHFMERELLEECADCFSAKEVACDIINLVRNICMRNGSVVKGYVSMGWLGDRATAYDAVLKYPHIKKKYQSSSRMVIKFEDLKRYPSEILLEICQKWDIVWSKVLLQTTEKGKKSNYDNGEKLVEGFDLEPVYNNYEKYFSEIDRLRIMLINAPWQKEYGYPYEKAARFSRKELQELFLKEFRFEKMIAYRGKEPELEVRYKQQLAIMDRLRRVWMMEMLGM